MKAPASRGCRKTSIIRRSAWPTSGRRFAVDPQAKVKVPNVLALQLARNPKAIANHVYANRMGNGPPESGDGWRHRGFGPFQLTGKDNQEAFGEAVGLPVDQVPDYLRTTNGGAMSMCWFFKVNGLEDLAATPGSPTKPARQRRHDRAGRPQAPVRRGRRRFAEQGGMMTRLQRFNRWLSTPVRAARALFPFTHEGRQTLVYLVFAGAGPTLTIVIWLAMRVLAAARQWDGYMRLATIVALSLLIIVTGLGMFVSIRAIKIGGLLDAQGGAGDPPPPTQPE
jgi:hypothetical protein